MKKILFIILSLPISQSIFASGQPLLAVVAGASQQVKANTEKVTAEVTLFKGFSRVIIMKGDKSEKFILQNGTVCRRTEFKVRIPAHQRQHNKYNGALNTAYRWDYQDTPISNAKVVSQITQLNTRALAQAQSKAPCWLCCGSSERSFKIDGDKITEIS